MRRIRSIGWTLSMVTALSAIAGAQLADGRVRRMPAKHQVRLEKSIMVSMRDGVRLATDVYLPIGAGARLPVVLIRTPYDKRAYRKTSPDSSEAVFFASHGFAVVVQDTRGRYESEGDFTISFPDVEDGYDAIDWASKQLWSNGKVGGYGCSYVGDTQIMAAKALHPAYAAMIPQAAGSSYPHRGFMMRNNGAVELIGGLSWFASSGSKLRYGPPRGTPQPQIAQYGDYFSIMPRVPGFDVTKQVWNLPIRDILKNAGIPPTDWESLVTHGPADPWWLRLGYLSEADRFDTPALQIDSWFDSDIAMVLEQFNLMRRNGVSSRARDNQFIIISPSLHCQSEEVPANLVLGERAFGDARRDYWKLYVDWFDHWLRGVDNGVTRMPKIQYYLMGKNEWRSAEAWPIPGTRFTEYYLRSGGRANSRTGDGTLSRAKPGNEPADHYVYDPMTPTPSRGAFTCCLGDRGAVDQRAVEMRSDILVYTTPPLEDGIEVTGPVQLTLYVSSSAKDTDFTAKLVDVLPDGTAYNVQEGILRARYRDGWDREVWFEPGKVVKLTVPLEATGHYFQRGHRIRVEIASANFPRFDRNLNTGGRNYDETTGVIARNSVHHSAQYPSHLLLPIVPPAAAAAPRDRTAGALPNSRAVTKSDGR